MASSVTHQFVSAKSDDADTTLVRPSNWNDTHMVVIDSDDISGTEWTDLTDGGETALHSHAGSAGEATDVSNGVDACLITLPWETILVKDGITASESAGGDAVIIGNSLARTFLFMGA